MATKYFCDRCNLEVFDCRSLTKVIDEEGDKFSIELCEPCLAQLKMFFKPLPLPHK
jgi:hypothetical protein